MVAVALSAALLGGRALIAIPAIFVALMLVGFGTALAGVHVPLVEPVILASTIIMGLSVAVARPVSPVLVDMIVGGFAFFHGHAHGTELADESALIFGAANAWNNGSTSGRKRDRTWRGCLTRHLTTTHS